MSNYESRPSDLGHKEFLLNHIRKKWGKVHKVYLGRRNFNHSKELRDWCSEQPGHWYHADGYELYYFSDENTAFHFRVRWAGISNPTK